MITYYLASSFFSDAGGWVAYLEPVMVQIEPWFLIYFMIVVA